MLNFSKAHYIHYIEVVMPCIIKKPRRRTSRLLSILMVEGRTISLSLRAILPDFTPNCTISLSLRAIRPDFTPNCTISLSLRAIRPYFSPNCTISHSLRAILPDFTPNCTISFSLRALLLQLHVQQLHPLTLTSVFVHYFFSPLNIRETACATCFGDCGFCPVTSLLST